ncbi:hypothetical protein COU37_01190 [Candidatus Micrarchaeota archaeon CG10_big_fil_rev_8_21_14_0_10_45_29]|nr:MAG: hypothetical protein COU37_01190 [Candidatus Micrarchaeota archaeon CG10_big_fil_rev_8_21_14_0_10_45_29]
MVLQYLGFAGLALLVIAWIPETLQNYKEKGKNLNLKFVMLYLFGSAFLAAHAYLINDFIFMALNSLAALIALANACIIILPGKNKKRRG